MVQIVFLCCCPFLFSLVSNRPDRTQTQTAQRATVAASQVRDTQTPRPMIASAVETTSISESVIPEPMQSASPTPMLLPPTLTSSPASVATIETDVWRINISDFTVQDSLQWKGKPLLPDGQWLIVTGDAQNVYERGYLLQSTDFFVYTSEPARTIWLHGHATGAAGLERDVQSTVAGIGGIKILSHETIPLVIAFDIPRDVQFVSLEVLKQEPRINLDLSAFIVVTQIPTPSPVVSREAMLGSLLTYDEFTNTLVAAGVQSTGVISQTAQEIGKNNLWNYSGEDAQERFDELEGKDYAVQAWEGHYIRYVADIRYVFDSSQNAQQFYEHLAEPMNDPGPFSEPFTPALPGFLGTCTTTYHARYDQQSYTCVFVEQTVVASLRVTFDDPLARDPEIMADLVATIQQKIRESN